MSKHTKGTAAISTKADHIRAQREAAAKTGFGGRAPAQSAAAAVPPAPASASAPKVAPGVIASAAGPAVVKATAPVSTPSAPASEPSAKLPSALSAHFARMREIGPAASRAVRAKRLARRVERLAKSLQTWSCRSDDGVDHAAFAYRQLTTAVDYLDEAALRLSNIPRDWRPSRGSQSAARDRVLEGAVVDVREKHCALYADILDPQDLVGLVVATVSKKGILICRGTVMSRIMLPRAHVRLAGAASSGTLPDPSDDE